MYFHYVNLFDQISTTVFNEIFFFQHDNKSLTLLVVKNLKKNKMDKGKDM